MGIISCMTLRFRINFAIPSAITEKLQEMTVIPSRITSFSYTFQLYEFMDFKTTVYYNLK